MMRPGNGFDTRWWAGIIVATAGTWIECVFAWGYGPFWPSALALFLAIFWRRIFSALILGAAAGGFLAFTLHPDTAGPLDLFTPVLTSRWNLTVLAFTFLCGGFAGLIQAGGGLESLARRLAGRRRDPRRFEFSAFALGLVCFFDGLANSLIVGRTLKPMADRLGVSREKLAYIADSTSAPVACLALATTWVATQIGLIRTGLEAAGLSLNAATVLITSIPANFYCWTALALVPLSIGYRWGNLGLRDPVGTGTTDLNDSAGLEGTEVSEAPAGPWRALVPMALFVFSLMLGLFVDGIRKAPAHTGLYEAVSYGDAVSILLLSILAASVTALFCMPSGIRGAARRAWWEGVRSMAYPLSILVAAWMLSATLQPLQTADVMAGLLTQNLPVALLPALVFLVAGVTAYTTGTSWGTMGLTLPLVIPIAAAYGEDASLLAGVVAAALSGAVFGDHASPFSDTTIISAAAAGCDPWDHVRTQWPYALTAAALATLTGFLPLGCGMPAWAAFPLCLGSLWALVFFTRGKERGSS